MGAFPGIGDTGPGLSIQTWTWIQNMSQQEASRGDSGGLPHIIPIREMGS